jgi:hypothetical protein
MPEMVAYPNSAVPFKIGGKVVPVSKSCASLYLAELMYEFNLEVARREKARDAAQELPVRGGASLADPGTEAPCGPEMACVASAVWIAPGCPVSWGRCPWPKIGVAAQAWRRAVISRRMSGVKISCIASSIFPPGTTMMLGRDMNESCSIDSR